MTLRDIEYFIAVAECGQFRAASEKCFVSQPTLSGQLKKLEEELEHPLFERSTRKVMLTPFGKEALSIARKIVDGVEQLKDKAAAMNDPFRGSVKIGIFPTLGPWLFPKLSLLLKEHYPHMEFFLAEEKTEDLQLQLSQGKLDAVLLALPQEMPAVSVRPLFSEPFYAAIPAGHPWEKKQTIEPEDFKGEKLLLLSDGHCFRDQALSLCQRYGAGEREQFRATGLETLRQMVRLGTGITLIPRLAIPEHQDPGISYRPISNAEFRRNIAFCFRTTHPRQVFFNDMRKVIREHCGPDFPVIPLETDH
jgi:LysR family transcriptional regulator, hydrogen peroxide-inducible genes activator